jgi:beta-lactamase superfamily II metal-dependent hydrolase
MVIADEESVCGGLTIRTHDIGQADARTIITEEENILVDADKGAIGREVEKGAQFDKCFVTHIDQDHVGGFKSLVERGCEIGKIVEPDENCFTVYDSKTRKPRNGVSPNTVRDYNEDLEQLDPDTIRQVTTGDLITLDSGAEIKILGPPPNVDGERPFESPKENSQEGELKGANENSLAFKLTSEDDRTALFMGDVENSEYCNAESWYVERHHDSDSEIDLDCDVLFGPHHGSNNAMSAEYIEATDPDVVIFSADPNRYNHPHPDVLERLHEHDGEMDVYLTAIHGTTSTELNEDLTAETEHATEETITKPWHIAKETAQRRDDPIPQWVENAELEERLEVEQKKNEELEEQLEAATAASDKRKERLDRQEDRHTDREKWVDRQKEHVDKREQRVDKRKREEGLDGREVPAEEAASYEIEANEQPERDDESQNLDGDNTETLRERIENLEAENKGLLDDKKTSSTIQES